MAGPLIGSNKCQHYLAVLEYCLSRRPSSLLLQPPQILKRTAMLSIEVREYVDVYTPVAVLPSNVQPVGFPRTSTKSGYKAVDWIIILASDAKTPRSLSPRAYHPDGRTSHSAPSSAFRCRATTSAQPALPYQTLPSSRLSSLLIYSLCLSVTSTRLTTNTIIVFSRPLMADSSRVYR